jgi:hypothetical protein
MVVELVAVRAREIAASNGNNLRKDWMACGLEAARQHPGLTPSTIDIAEDAPRPEHDHLMIPRDYLRKDENKTEPSSCAVMSVSRSDGSGFVTRSPIRCVGALQWRVTHALAKRLW